MTTILLAVVIVALFFDFANGWNDSANAIATVISTRVMSPMVAVVFAAILNFGGAFVSEKVAKTIGGDLIVQGVATPQIALAATIAATAWVTVCTLWGLPISGSHSLIGGLIGAAVTSSGLGWNALQWKGVKTVLVALVASPVLGFIMGYILLVLTYWVAYSMSRKTVRQTFSVAQIFSSGFMAFTHGMNDAQKAMGLITMALFSSQMIPSLDVPVWVVVICALAMALGTAAGGWKVIRTLGMNLAHIRPVEGFAAETGAGIVLLVAALMGVPVSTTHTITGSILGVGSAYHAKSVKWSIGKKILYAWILTLPATAIVAGLLAMVFGRGSGHL